MDVSAAGASAGFGSTIAESLVPPDRPGGAAASTSLASLSQAPDSAPREDGASALLQLLSTPQIHGLLSGIEAHRASAGGAAAIAASGMHLNAAGSAAAMHDVPRALTHLTEYVRLNPGHAGALLSAPSLIPIQGDVQGLLRHMTHEARYGAENTLAAARLAIAGAVELPRTLNGPDVLAVAERFAESGQLLNYIRAAELGEAVIASYLPVVSRKRDSALRRELPDLLRAMWHRVPLLVLLVGWFVLGAFSNLASLLARMAGVALLSPGTIQTGFEAWGIGFLALVGIQFCVSVYRARSGSASPE